MLPISKKITETKLIQFNIKKMEKKDKRNLDFFFVYLNFGKDMYKKGSI